MVFVVFIGNPFRSHVTSGLGEPDTLQRKVTVAPTGAVTLVGPFKIFSGS